MCEMLPQLVFIVGSTGKEEEKGSTVKECRPLSPSVFDGRIIGWMLTDVSTAMI